MATAKPKAAPRKKRAAKTTKSSVAATSDIEAPQDPAIPDAPADTSLVSGIVLTLTGADRYSITGYNGNPIRRWDQVTMNEGMSEYLLEQTTRNNNGAEVPYFEKGVVARPRRVRKTEAQLQAELRNKRAANLDPNAAMST